MPSKQNKKDIYAVLSLNNFSLEAFTAKSLVANYVGCHRNTLAELSKRTIINDFIIFPVKLTKIHKT